MTKDRALYAFFSEFGLDTYASTSVPEHAEFPYLTYAPVFDVWGGGQVSIAVNLWYATNENTPSKPQYSEVDLNAKAQEISNAIGGGKYLPCDGGAILLTRGTPFSQSMADSTEPTVKRRYINVLAEYITLN